MFLKRGDEPVALAPHAAQRQVRHEADAAVVERLHELGRVGGAQLDRRHPVGHDEGHLGAARGQELGDARALVLAVLVVDQHLAGERGLARRARPSR